MAERHDKPEKAKTIGLDAATHRKLKMLCAEQGWTMTQAVEELLKRMENEPHGRAASPGETDKDR